jgi:hypothetical protein
MLRVRLDALDVRVNDTTRLVDVSPAAQIVLDFLESVTSSSHKSVVRGHLLANHFGWWIEGYATHLLGYSRLAEREEGANYWPTLKIITNEGTHKMNESGTMPAKAWEEAERTYCAYRFNRLN